ncbi:hypothetical protein CCZ01_01470 [Helicobacter monodelphidis]|uniref:hypothetical protein n=1 Tax=Helicobacter sp. 15-1451 TaxID=2004995 RepID=UPI000DCD1086|nr:hypothetical protein [Helicobacter sp. 15-1451]RAX58892.1 hypothetical protein CCZ01_01470 [Helicobacter sp. 15-1451]
MINQVTQGAEVSNKMSTTNNTPKQFNNTIPISLEVMEKLSPTRYMLRLGNTTMQTKSLTELVIGAKYWAQMGRGSDGLIALSQLTPQPKILAHLANAPMRLSGEELKELFKDAKTNPWDNLKNQLLERAVLAENKADFNFYMQMLLSMHNRVLTLPLNIEEREAMLQMRKKKAGQYHELEFYAVFPNLGAVGGKLTSDGKNVNLALRVTFPTSAALLEANKEFLKGIQNFSITIDKHIEPLYDFKESHSSLLDMKG